MDAPRTARLQVEVLHRVCQVVDPPVDPCLLERLVEDLTRGPDKRVPDAILAVSGLLADQHELGVAPTLPEGV